jgi:hypothetical protein
MMSTNITETEPDPLMWPRLDGLVWPHPSDPMVVL